MLNDDRRTFRESLSSAGNSSDLTVHLDRRGDADAIIAAGKATHQIGRYLDQLTSEWDVCTPPRRLSRADIEKLAATMPRVPVQRPSGVKMALDLVGANAAVQQWADGERRRIIGRLKSLPKLLDPHAGITPWLAARGANNPDRILLDVLGWYLDRKCPVCHGTKWETVAGTNRQSATACKVCRGVGDRDVPHGRLGRDVLEQLVRSADKARATAREVLRNIRPLKYAAAGKSC